MGVVEQIPDDRLVNAEALAGACDANTLVVVDKPITRRAFEESLAFCAFDGLGSVA